MWLVCPLPMLPATRQTRDSTDRRAHIERQRCAPLAAMCRPQHSLSDISLSNFLFHTWYSPGMMVRLGSRHRRALL